MYSHNFSQTLDPPKKIKVTFCKEEEESNDKEVIAKVADIKDRSSIKDEDKPRLEL